MNLRETFRYLGYHGQEPDEAAKNLAVICWKELEQAATPRSFYREYPLEFTGDTGIVTPVFETQSANLRKNLKDCEKLLVFAATLGAGVDHLIQRYTKIQMSKAVIIQAAAAAMLEDYCDEVNEQIRRDYEIRGLYLRPRFSPGYGDLPLTVQGELLSLLDAPRRVGLTASASHILIPRKSVTAILGVSDREIARNKRSCLGCPAQGGCQYRKAGGHCGLL